MTSIAAKHFIELIFLYLQQTNQQKTKMAEGDKQVLELPDPPKQGELEWNDNYNPYPLKKFKERVGTSCH